ncbi:hypothetical protein ID866_1468 [Astraeus odoratus]|nr:hypothetical protein ID866_1468 [Astraeus odoratus]
MQFLSYLWLSDNLISRPVPTLSERQFVVGKSSLNKTEEITQRELFWYREELLKIIHAQWKEASGSRFGDLSFRQQRMTVDMLNTLKTDLIRVDLSFAREETEDGSPLLLERRGRKFLTRANTLNKLQVQVTNTNSSALIIMINLSLSPEDHVLFEGTLTDIPLGRIDSGKSKNVDVPLCFLCAGQFEVSAEARKVGVGENIGGQTPVGWTRAIVISTE